MLLTFISSSGVDSSLFRDAFISILEAMHCAKFLHGNLSLKCLRWGPKRAYIVGFKPTKPVTPENPEEAEAELARLRELLASQVQLPSRMTLETRRSRRDFKSIFPGPLDFTNADDTVRYISTEPEDLFFQGILSPLPGAYLDDDKSMKSTSTRAPSPSAVPKHDQDTLSRSDATVVVESGAVQSSVSLT